MTYPKTTSHPKRGSRFLLLFFLSCVLLVPFASVQAQTDNDISTVKKVGQAFVAISKKASPSVVFIEAERQVEVTSSPYFNDPFDMFGNDLFERFFGRPRSDQNPRSPRKQLQKGQGSGFIISADGYILTNNHVVGEANKIKVKLNDNRDFEAKLIGADPRSEVAVIKIEATDLPALTLGDSDNMEVGEWVIAIGNPFGLSHTVTTGVVSAKGRSSVGIADYEDFIQTDAAINPGNSGGPLLNLEGQVIGINTAIISRSGGYMGIGFAIPSNMVKSIFDQIVKTGSVTRGYLGILIQPLSRDLAKSFKLDITEGVLVSDVMKDSPAEKGGLKSGDVIIEMDGKAVAEVGPFRNTVSLLAPGTVVKLKVIRDGSEKNIDMTIGKLPDEEGEAAESAQPDILEKLGLSVQTLTEEIAQRAGYEGETGVIVTQVERGSEADNEGLRPGTLIQQVDSKDVKDVNEFNKAMKDASGEESILLRVKDRAQGRIMSRYVVLNLK
ncbi:MAG: DegQ family serine endoprotease [Candidatus Omnitrophota bacterium]|jgi:serine protease Do|nr:MAG: DegQ family serine endoprotease [Candidatus Omnitrophota bacterium]